MMMPPDSPQSRQFKIQNSTSKMKDFFILPLHFALCSLFFAFCEAKGENLCQSGYYLHRWIIGYDDVDMSTMPRKSGYFKAFLG